MNAVYLLLCLLQAPMDPVRSQDMSSLYVRSNLPLAVERPQVGPSPYLQKVMESRFRERLDKLAKAVEEFSAAYNKDSGKVWPADKAEALRKAMAELQKADPNLKPDKSPRSQELSESNSSDRR